MRCPRCAVDDDRVIDSREAENGVAVRRRRECLACAYRFSTIERPLGAVLFVKKRSGQREPFAAEKLLAGVQAACKNRPVSQERMELLVSEVEESLRALGTEVASQQIGVRVLEALQELDAVAYLRFASVYKGFEDPGDFAREAGLLEKASAPKTHETSGVDH